MRILQGKWAGRQLVSPSGRVRPTAEEVRALWLRELEPELRGARLLELYAGTGALGLEALSRGARRCDFVENSPSALHALKSNVTALRVRGKTRIFKHDALVFVEGIQPDTYDIALADPPYRSRQLDRLVQRWLADPFSRVLSVEHAFDHPLPPASRTLAAGETTLSFYGF